MFDVDPESGLIYNITKDMATHQVMNMESIKDGSDSVVIADVSCMKVEWRIC